MKKILLTMFMAVTTLIAMAQTKTYTDNLIVTIDGESSEPQETTIVVEQNTGYTDNLVVTIDGESSEPQETTIIVKQNANGTYTLSLNNFVLGDIPVGNIVVDNITATETNGVKEFTVNRNINITAGEGNDDWMGPLLGEVPVNLTGKMDAENLYCSIDIDMSEQLGQIINVVFGDENSVTSIENIAAENGVKRIFDITGREIKEITVPGIYIVNGKKIFVK